MSIWLVTGASGFLGYHICRRMVDAGAVVRGIDIAPFDYPDLAGRVEFVQGDIRDASLLRKAMEGVTVVMRGLLRCHWHRGRRYTQRM